MKRRFRVMNIEDFSKHIDILVKDLRSFIEKENLKIDYMAPILRSGAVPAVYIANKLNVVKFAPFQTKHIKRKRKKETTELIYNPIPNLNIKKEKPVFLIIDGNHSSGTSCKLCIDAILGKYQDAQILYVCIARKYNSISFKDKIIYESCSYLVGENLSIKESKKLNLNPYYPVYPWETMADQLEHPDNLEENIFF